MIKSITFGILSEEEIIKNSACLVNSSKSSGLGSVYDPRMGPLNATDLCETCFEKNVKCPGHFGHIEFVEPIFHPLFIKKLSGVKLNENEITINGVRMSPVDFLKSFPDLKRFVMKNIPVLPHCSRPGDDDLTIHYMEIVKLNKNITGTTDVKEKGKLLKSLFIRVNALIDNSNGKVKHVMNLYPLKGIKERLCGKSGLIRGNIMGKRVNHSGRTVIGSNPLLALDELEVPEGMTKILTIPEKCTANNFEKLVGYLTTGQVSTIERSDGKIVHIEGLRECNKVRAYPGDIVKRAGKKHFVKDHRFETKENDVLFRNGKKIVVKIPVRKISLNVGDTVHRHLQENDYVVLNRQPTLHSASMQAMRIKIGKHKTLKFNLAITKSFNADFDGDEMNIYVPQTPESQSEVRNLMAATNNIMSKQSGKPLVGIVQDACLGAYLMTKYDRNIDVETFNDIVMEIKFTHVKKEGLFDSKLEKIERVLQFKRKPYRKYSGKTLVSLILPDYLSLTTDTIEIYDGVICSGFIDKKTMSDIAKVVHNTFSNLHAADLIDNVQYVTRGYLLRFGFTIDLGDCKPTHESRVGDAVEEYLNDARLETDETRIVSCLNNAKNKGQKITKESLKPTNHFFDTILSGSKGDFSNVVQIMGLLGQQNLKCGRPSDSLRHLHRDEFEAKGFIRGSFMKGLNPFEFWYHAMSGREGVCDTSVNTSTSGYIQRKLIKNLEDVMIYNDGTVRNHMGNIFQDTYGGTMNVNCSKGLVDVQSLANKLTLEYEEN